MSFTEYLLYFVGIPALIVAVLVARFWSGRSVHPTTYQLSDRWTHPPILWAAVDETGGRLGGHGHTEFSVGGGASGKW